MPFLRHSSMPFLGHGSDVHHPASPRDRQSFAHWQRRGRGRERASRVPFPAPRSCFRGSPISKSMRSDGGLTTPIVLSGDGTMRAGGGRVREFFDVDLLPQDLLRSNRALIMLRAVVPREEPTMKAALFHAGRPSFSVEDIPDPVLLPASAVVEVLACFVSRSIAETIEAPAG